MEIKLIVIDIDGTLLNSQGSLSDENKNAIQKAREQNVQTVLCTGRPIGAVHDYLEALDFVSEKDLVITSNGGFIYKSKTGEVIREVTLTREECLEIYALGEELEMPVTFIDSDHIYEPEYPEGVESIYTGGDYLKFVEIDINDLSSNFTANQVMVSRPEKELDAFISKIPKKYYEQYSIYRSASFMLEFLPKSVDKGYAMQIVGDLLSVPNEHIMGIGDHENDLSLIKKAGWGVAVDNAIKEVKKAADYITKSNDEHGVAYAIHKFVLDK